MGAGQCCGAGPGDAEQGGQVAEAVTRQGGQDQEGQSPGQADCSATETERRKDRLPARPSPSRVAHSATSPACQACSRLPKLLHAWPWPLAAMGGFAPGASQRPGEGGPAGRRGGRAPGTSQRPLTEGGPLFFQARRTAEEGVSAKDSAVILVCKFCGQEHVEADDVGRSPAVWGQYEVDRLCGENGGYGL